MFHPKSKHIGLFTFRYQTTGQNHNRDTTNKSYEVMTKIRNEEK